MAPVITDYVFDDVAGIGGMGVTYRAHRVADAEPLAVKVVKDELSNDPWVIRRFRNEATVGRLLSHPNIARVLDHGTTDDGAPYLVLEWIAGEPLGVAIAANGPVTLRTAVAITSQILGALGHAHARGIVHADVKSDNILVTSIGGHVHATLIDFGLAQLVGHPPPPANQMISGTPEFMAPEVIRGEPATPRSDLYAVGIVLYELLTGSTPFAGRSPVEVFRGQLEDEVVPPSLRCPDCVIPPTLERVVMSALQKDPTARFPTAAEFDTALAAAIALAPVEGRRTSRSSVSRTMFSTERPTRDWTKRALAPPRRRRAKGTQPRDTTAVGVARRELAVAATSRQRAAAYLKIACALVDDRRLAAAAAELETAIESLGDADVLWPVQLTLAAIYDGLHDRPRARVTAVASRNSAVRARSATGIYRAEVLLGRLAPRRAH